MVAFEDSLTEDGGWRSECAQVIMSNDQTARLSLHTFHFPFSSSLPSFLTPSLLPLLRLRTTFLVPDVQKAVAKATGAGGKELKAVATVEFPATQVPDQVHAPPSLPPSSAFSL